MRRELAVLVVAGLSAGSARAAAQATGTTTFNAPYRAFVRSEIGVSLSFPNGGGTALEGAYRIASHGFDLGFKAGFFTPSGAGDTELLLGAEARQRVITHTIDFPLDGAVIVGVGGNFVSGASQLIIPVGLSLGRRLDPRGSTVSIVPYVQPTMYVLAGSAVTNHVRFALGLGGDLLLRPGVDARLSAWPGASEGGHAAQPQSSAH